MKFRISNPYRFLPSLYLFHEKNRTTQTKERTRIEEIIFEIEYRLLTTTPPPHELSSRNVFWTILTNENRPTTRGEAISTSHLPKIPLIFHPPIFKTKAFHPLILEEARLEQISLSLSRFGITRRSVEDCWHGRTGRQWHRVVLHHFWDRYLEAGRRVSVAIALQKNARF